MYLSIGRAAKVLGVSISTLRRWEKTKKLMPQFKTIGKHRRYAINKLKEFMGDFSKSSNKRVIAYARVSSHDQKEDLIRQIERLETYLKKRERTYEIISDLGSGLNYKKRGLKKLIKLILSGEVSKIILTHKDRLLRFGSEIIFNICDFFGTEIEIIEEITPKSDEEALAFDVLEIITVFSARLYGKRAHQNRKAA